MKKCTDSSIIDAATGAGKSHIIAAVAKWLNDTSGKRVLCLAPSKELVEQNHMKFVATGSPASFYSASVGEKSLRHSVIFGTPLSVKNNLDKFRNFAAVVIDEAHGITPTIKDIVSDLKKKNPKLRVLGLTATPYRMNTGYIYEIDEDNNAVDEKQTKNPYFKKLIAKVQARELIDLGFLTPPHAEIRNGYDAVKLEVNKMGNFDAREVEEVFEGQGRKTSEIVKDIVNISQYRNGVMIFAATIKHAEEVLESLPVSSAMITGKTEKKERERIIKSFKAQKIKYLVNVAVLTTGFDAEHVDVVAILRATESVGLLQQIVGRGLRICAGKEDCLILDYAENLERHCPDGDMFNPNIEVSHRDPSINTMKCICPECDDGGDDGKGENEFVARFNPEGFEKSRDGYFLDLAGVATEVPSHHGRRCGCFNLVAGNLIQCDYRWTVKECPECEHGNDITARYCESCKAEIVDPNEKLVREFQKMKKDPYSKSVDKVITWKCGIWKSNNGNTTLRVDYTTQYRTFPVWYMSSFKKQWNSLCLAAFNEPMESEEEFVKNYSRSTMPETITVKKSRRTGFFTIIEHNEKEDQVYEVPEVA